MLYTSPISLTGSSNHSQLSLCRFVVRYESYISTFIVARTLNFENTHVEFTAISYHKVWAAVA